MDRSRSAMLDFLLEDELEQSFSESDEEYENVSDSDHDSESEESGDEMEGESFDATEDFFIGKGMLSKARKGHSGHEASEENLMWMKVPYKSSKTKRKNIVKFKTGLTEKSRDVTSELSAFHKMFSPNMIEDLVRFTNQRIQSKGPRSRERDSQPTSVSELSAVLGMLYLIGIKKGSHTNVLELWDKDGTGLPILRSLMSYKRFLFLLRNMRFDDKDTRSERRKTDKLAAVRDLNDQFIENCKTSYIPGEMMTIDEMLHPFRGRCSFIQYMPKKPAKYGLKAQALCDAKSFYTYNMELYCGQQPDGPYKTSNSPTEIVKRLVSPIKNTHRNITMDNWYTSLALGIYLLGIGLTCLGTIRKNRREIPAEFLPNKSREIQSSVFGFQKEAMLVSYVPKINRGVILLSTMHDQPDIDESSGKPMIILDYNDTKGGVDTVDKMCAVYSVSRITRLWTQDYFYVLLNIAGINAQVIYMEGPKAECVPRRIFLKNLALSLMKEHLLIRSKIPTLPCDLKSFLRNYLNVEAEQLQPLPDRNRGRCKCCKNSSTTIRCGTCNRFVCRKHSTILAKCEDCQSAEVEYD